MCVKILLIGVLKYVLQYVLKYVLKCVLKCVFKYVLKFVLKFLCFGLHVKMCVQIIIKRCVEIFVKMCIETCVEMCFVFRTVCKHIKILDCTTGQNTKTRRILNEYIKFWAAWAARAVLTDQNTKTR